MLVIRLVRRGKKGQPFYTLALAEKQKAVQKKIVRRLGQFNPLLDTKEAFQFDQAAVETAIQNGAQPSATVARLLVAHGMKSASKFVPVRPTKPKKETPPAEPVAEEKTDAPAEEPPAESDEAPAEEAEKAEVSAENSTDEKPAEKSE